MSPTTSFHDHHAKMNSNGLRPPPLRINKDSHTIKKSSSSSSPSPLGVGVPNKPLQRQPVIIYAHSPKIIHTHPKDFMALVQKLTGRPPSEDYQVAQKKQGKGDPMLEVEAQNVKIVVGNEENESSSVITTDENCGSIDDGQVKSCFVVSPMFEPPNPYTTSNIPLFTPNSSADFLCPNQTFYNYADPLFFTPNMRGSISSSSALEGMREIQEY